jgi:hypothetical protein
MAGITQEQFEQLRNAYYQGNDIQYIPFEDFDIGKRLKGEDGKRFKIHIAPDVESLFKNEDIKKSAIRFADLFLANALDGYRRPIHHGVELAKDKTSKKSIQQKRVRQLSDTTVKKVINLLIKRQLINKEEAYKVRIPKEHGPERDKILAKHGIENKPYIDEWQTIRTTAWVATDKLQKLMTGVETSKRCSRCSDIKDLSMFPEKESVCKECRAKDKRILRAKKKAEANQK